LTINGGTIDNTSGWAILYTRNNAQYWNGSFAVAGTINLDLGDGAVMMNASPTITVVSNTFTVDGVVDDGGSGFTLTKAGAGALTLTGSNTYSGGTAITGGTLNLNGAHSSYSGDGFVLWDESDGPSVAYSGNTDGGIPSETFQIEGTIAPTPEPSSFLLLGSGLAALAGLAKRKLMA